MNQTQSRGSRAANLHWRSTAACALAMVAALLAVHPVISAPFSDDFSYIYSAKRAAETGRLIYNGWAAPFFGYQAYLGALFVRMFGFSFTVVRASGMLLAVLNVAVLHRLFLRLTRNNGNAVTAALCVGLGPTTLVHSVIFFTDLPAMFAFSVTLYLCVRALQADSSAEIRRWLLCATVCNLVLGSVRQTAWGGALALVPMTGWLLRRHPGVLKLTIALETASLAVVGAALLWFRTAPYTVQEKLFGHVSRGMVLLMPFLPLYAVLELAPLFIALVSLRELRKHKAALVMGLLAACAALLFARVARPLPVLLSGALLQWSVPHARDLGLVLLIFAAFCGGLAIALGTRCMRESAGESPEKTSFRTLLLALLPYLLINGLLITTRNGMWPRYVMTLTPAVAALLLRIHAERSFDTGFRFSAAAAAFVMACFSIVTAHDTICFERPYLAVKTWALQHGIPRDQIEAGMPEDGWFEVSTGHTVHDPRIRYPAGANTLRPLTAGQMRCHGTAFAMFPDLHPRYAVGTAPSDCVELPALYSATQQFWMRPSLTANLFRFVPAQQLP